MAEILISDLTTIELNGEGVYDNFMQVNQLRLQEEFSQNRIKGPDYSKVYLGMMEATMQQAIAFLLGRQQADKQAELLAKQVELTAAEILKVEAETALIIQNTLNAEKTNELIAEQIAKIVAETGLLLQKTDTEKAQILDLINGVAIDGVIGKQKALYQAQTDGFARDAEQKLAKIMADSWSVRRSTDEGENPAGTGLTNVDIEKVLSAAQAGIGVS